MEFLVQIDVALPPDLPAEQREALLADERRRGEELVADGAIQGIWRIPGRQANVGIWEAVDASALHDLLVSLPVWRYASVNVTALAKHPLAR
jgi:muconolactone D-isomerase